MISSSFRVNISLIYFSSLGLKIIFSALRVMISCIHFSAIRVKTLSSACRVNISLIHFSSKFFSFRVENYIKCIDDD